METNRTNDGGTNFGKWLAGLFLLLLLAALGARFWAVERAYDWVGPTHITVGGETVYVSAGGELYRLADTGELTGAFAASQTGLEDIPIDLRVLADGSLLLAEQGPARIRICRVDSWQCRPAATVFEYLVERQFKVLPGVSENEWFLTDSKGDTLWRLTPGGTPERQVSDRTLAGPNDLAYGSDGNLWVADTDHRRILELVPKADGGFNMGREHSTRNGFLGENRHYPMMLARGPDSRWWVVQAAEFSEGSAGVVIYHETRGPEASVDLPAGAYPTDIAALGETMLITDMQRFMVYAVNSATLEVSEFGDEAFIDRLSQIRQSHVNFKRLGTACLAGVILFAALMIAAAVSATPKNKRWTEPPAFIDFDNAPENVPQTRRIHWLERDPKMDRAFTWFGRIGFALVVFWVLGSFAIWVWAATQAGPGADEELAAHLDRLGLILFLGTMALALVIPIVWLQLRHLKNELGTDGKRLYMRLHDGRELSVEPQRLFYTRAAILHDQYTFPLLGAQQKSVYLPGEVDKWLAPLLRQATRLNATDAMKYRWNRRDSVLIWSVVAGIVLAVVVIVVQMMMTW